MEARKIVELRGVGPLQPFEFGEKPRDPYARLFLALLFDCVNSLAERLPEWVTEECPNGQTKKRLELILALETDIVNDLIWLEKNGFWIASALRGMNFYFPDRAVELGLELGKAKVLMLQLAATRLKRQRTSTN